MFIFQGEREREKERERERVYKQLREIKQLLHAVLMKISKYGRRCVENVISFL